MKRYLFYLVQFVGVLVVSMLSIANATLIVHLEILLKYMIIWRIILKLSDHSYLLLSLCWFA